MFRKHTDTPPSYQHPREFYLDELFPDAVEVTIETQCVSAGRLQSALRIGSIRATKLMTELEEHGIIGPDRGNRPREVFYSMDRWNNEKVYFAWKPEEPKVAQTPRPVSSPKKNRCPYCDSRVPNGALICWRCRNRLPVDPVKQVISFILSFLIVLIIILHIPSLISMRSSPEPTMSKSEYISQCREVSYEKLSRNPENYKGDYLTFVGEVIQVIEYGSAVHLRVNVTEVESYGYYYSTDTIYVTARLHEDGNRILEKDIIRLYGQCEGLHTYTAVLGNSISIPRIDAEYWELIK